MRLSPSPSSTSCWRRRRSPTELDGMPTIGLFVLSSRGDKPFGNIGHAKAQLDIVVARQRAAARLGRDLMAEEQPIGSDHLPPWRLHDARRSVATGLQRQGVRLEVIEAVL